MHPMTCSSFVIFLICLAFTKLVFGQDLDEGCGDSYDNEQGLYLLYGTDQGDTCVKLKEDACKKVDVSCPIPFKEQTFKKIYVCVNGLVCFGKAYKGYLPPLHGETNRNFNNRFCLAPYHADIDFKTGPSDRGLCYQIYDLTRRGVSALDSAFVITKELVKDFYDVDIDPVFVLKATWSSAPRYRGSSSETVDFQLIYVTDGWSAYTFYKYKDGYMNFDNGPVFIGLLIDGLAQGLDDGGDGGYFRQADVRVNSGSRRGVTSFELTPSGTRQINAKCACKSWHKRELIYKDTYRERLNNMPRCPCSIFLTFIDRRFQFLSFRRRTWTFALRGSDLYFPSGKTCTYKNRGNYIQRGNRAGRFQKYNQLTHQYQYMEEDEQYREICCDLSNTCNLFEEVRPTVRNCKRTRFFRFGGGVGDPHFGTLDSYFYTFNGHGEYILLASDMNDLQIQTRTSRLDLGDGKISDATIFSGFAVQVTDAWVQAELNSAGNLRVTAGPDRTRGGDITQRFRNDTFEFDLNEMSLGRDGDTLMISFNKAGVFFNVTLTNKILQMSIALVDLYKNQVSGLLGDFDGIKAGDLRSRDASTSVSNSSTEREIFNIAKTLMTPVTWLNFYSTTLHIKVIALVTENTYTRHSVYETNYWKKEEFKGKTTAEESIFVYYDGKSHGDHIDQDFVPKFFDEFSEDEIAEGTAQCNEGNDSCIYDYVVTKDADLARDTTAVFDKAAETEAVIANTIPNLSLTDGATLVDGVNYLYMNINEAIKLTFLGEDDGTLTFELFETTAEATLGTPADDGTVDVDLVVQDTNPVSLSVVATDDKGELSPVIDAVIVLCTGCSSHGNCTDVIREDDRATENFKYATCECEPYWEGDDCELDVDGCDGSPCDLIRSCEDTNADMHKANQSLEEFTCSPCPLGYREEGYKCEDVNECEGSNLCSQVCVNTEQSYTCQCNPGYRLAEDGNTCTDNNECDESTHNCDQICNNVDGSFNCTCLVGFTLNETTSACDPDITPPSGCDAIDCSNAAGCTLNESSSAVCFCNSGYELQSGTCINIDECLTNACSQTCTDNNGSYACGCYVGYQLEDDKISCSPCAFPLYGENCGDSCEIGRGFLRCDLIKGSICRPGWAGTSCDLDVDECIDANACGDVNKVCLNTYGSYKCTCRTGYTEENDVCVDIDECNEPGLNTCEQICQNSPGGFSCSCKTGLKINPSDSTKCIYIDQCATGISGCEQICRNNAAVGEFTCDCNSGYTLNDDLMTCTLVTDPCASFPSISCAHACKLVDGAPVCMCRIGFVLASDEQTCIDVNECDSSLNLNGCSEQDSCVNINGGYNCSCSPGFKLENDLRTCTKCDATHFGEDCASECGCGAGATTCDHVTGCVCESGWTGEKCNIDKNECGNFPCTGDNEECTNTPGSYTCNCKAGYSPDQSDVCRDVNECGQAILNDCSQVCTNNAGGYECSCNVGFLQDGNSCNDINECAGQNDCTHSCENSIGSYRCTCEAGYKLDLTDRKTCIPEEQCPVTNVCENNTECAWINGADTCSCLAGFQFVAGSSVQCEDIPECSLSPSPCSQTCTELEGGYQCTCNQAGYRLDTDQITCVDCADGTFGVGCANNCACNVSNTLSCGTVDGTCTCKDGWEGTTCNENIDECLDASAHNCPQQSTCVDTLGSFLCQCQAGYIKAGDESCQACSEGTFGDDCANDCTCIQANTATCNSVNGDCSCKEGWSGNDCSQNINECTQNTFTCTENSRCFDTQGSYSCECYVGFIKLTDGTCAACEPGTYGLDCAEVCPCNSSNTESCNAVNGLCTCKPGWESSDCSVNVNECTRNTFECPDQSTCEDTQGSYVCNCNSGYIKTTIDTCGDIDECAQNNAGCLQKCENTVGSYICSCDIGYQGTGNDCTMCVESYGEQCANQCNCDADKSTGCNHVTGCVCKPGYVGDTCTDVDECAAVPSVCQANSVCTNTPGGHTCTCNPGYKDEQGNCLMCSGNKYGDNCNNDCNCTIGHAANPSQICHHISGSCTCNSYWNGTRCEDDIDECVQGTDNCNKDNEGCHNTENGYTCSCILGYIRDGSNSCVQDTKVTTTTAVPANRRNVHIELRLNITLRVDLRVTATYIKFETEVKTQLEVWYQTRLRDIVYYIIPRGLRPGSLILDYDVNVPESSVPDVAVANTDFANNQHYLPVFDDKGYVKDMTVGNTKVSVSDVPSDELVCQFYEASIDGCGQEADCMVKDGKPLCEPREDDDFALKFGLGFGIPMFLLCIAAILIVVFYLQRRGRTRHIRRDDDDRSDSMFAKHVPVRIVTTAPYGPLYGAPDMQPYAESEYSDYGLHPETEDGNREGRGSWNFVFGNLRSNEDFHIQRPAVDLPRGRHY